MMSAISEAWTIMNKHMEMKYDDIGKVFEKWSSEGELVSGIPLTSRNLLTAVEKYLLS
jgi:6-phosphogluconate dehydrogenase